VTARIDSFEGLHVLLVTEDEARAQAIAKSLRERKAHVGDVRAGAKDPIAMRGADLLVIDARRGSSAAARVAEVRSDVRARWASVASIDYTTLASEDGSVDLRALEGIVSRLAGMDKALTERARKEASFETTLAPLGPTRTLRALALAGPTLHVELTDGALTAQVDLADELLVAAFAERKGERWEAWHALARVLGMTDANVVVTHRAHPSAMNIMEPVDQALEGAAQERVRSPELFDEPAEELSGLRGERAESLAGIAQAIGQSAAPAASALAGGAAQISNGAPQGRKQGVLSVPPPAPQAVAAQGIRPAVRPNVPFADVPTDPAAPGLLQRMARAPANDAPEVRSSRGAPAPAPTLSIEREDGDEQGGFEGEEEGYDQGEVTVVADASQLDILRETLGRLDSPGGGGRQGPLTSTMPAPPGPGANDDELEFASALKAAGDAAAVSASEPEQERAEGAAQPQVPNGTPPRDAELSASEAAESLAASQVPAAGASAPSTSKAPGRGASPLGGATLRLDASDVARHSKAASSSKARAYILVALVLMALAAVGAMLWSQQANRAESKAPAQPAAPAKP
jgi:hypothetical protein